MLESRSREEQQEQYLQEALQYYMKVVQIAAWETKDVGQMTNDEDGVVTATESVINMYGRAMYKCAIIYETMNRNEEAEQCYEMCLQRFPQKPHVSVRFALLLDGMGRNVDCNCVYQKGLQTIQDRSDKEKLTEEYVKWLTMFNEREKQKTRVQRSQSSNSDSFLGVRAYGNDATLLSPVVYSKSITISASTVPKLDLVYSNEATPSMDIEDTDKERSRTENKRWWFW